jgi:hypothetical protein
VDAIFVSLLVYVPGLHDGIPERDAAWTISHIACRALAIARCHAAARHAGPFGVLIARSWYVVGDAAKAVVEDAGLDVARRLLDGLARAGDFIVSGLRRYLAGVVRPQIRVGRRDFLLPLVRNGVLLRHTRASSVPRAGPVRRRESL